MMLAASSMLYSCSKNVQVATVKVDNGKNASMYLNTSGSCYIKSIEASDSSGRLAILNSNNDLYVWDMNSGNTEFIMSLAAHRPVRMRFSPDGNILATCGFSDGRIKFWDAKTGSLAGEIKSVTKESSSCCFGGSSSDSINAIDFSSDGKVIVSADSRGNIKFWDIGNGSLVREFNWHPQESIVYGLRFDRKGEFLAVAGGETHYRQEARTGTRTYCCSYGKNGCQSYCTETYTYYVTVPYYYPMVKIFRLSDNSVVASNLHPAEGMINDMEFNADGTFIASNTGGRLLLFSTDNPGAGFDVTPGFFTQVEDFSGRGQIITAYGGDVSVRNSLYTKSNVNFKTGERNIAIMKYIKRGGIIVLSGGNTVRFWNIKGEPRGLLSTTGKKNWVFVKPDGYFDGTEDGVKKLYWKAGNYIITMKDFGDSFKKKGLIETLFKEDKSLISFDVASKLVGKIGKSDSREVLVYAPESSGLKMGDRLFVVIENKRVMLEVVYPMMTTARCRLTAESVKYKNKIRAGMPVFR